MEVIKLKRYQDMQERAQLRAEEILAHLQEAQPGLPYLPSPEQVKKDLTKILIEVECSLVEPQSDD